MLELKDIKSLAVKHKSGIRTVNIGMNLCLYIEPPFEEIAENVLKVYEAFLEICPVDNLSWFQTNSMEKHEKITMNTLNMPRTWLTSAKKNKDLMEFEIKNGISKHYSDTPDWKFHFLSRSRTNRFYPIDANFINILFPCEYAADRLPEFTNFVLYACEQLPFLSGHAGYALEVSPYFKIRGAFSEALTLGMRYSELDISEPEFSQVVKKYHGIKGVNWLTLLGPDFAKEITLSARKEAKKLTFREITNGLVIQAGEQPMVADGSHGEYVTAYREAYTLVKPWIVSKPFPLSVSKHFEERVDKTLKWIHRFGENE